MQEADCELPEVEVNILEDVLDVMFGEEVYQDEELIFA